MIVADLILFKSTCLLCVPKQMKPIQITNLAEYLHGLMQERRHSIANALELRLSCINPSI